MYQNSIIFSLQPAFGRFHFNGLSIICYLTANKVAIILLSPRCSFGLFPFNYLFLVVLVDVCYIRVYTVLLIGCLAYRYLTFTHIVLDIYFVCIYICKCIIKEFAARTGEHNNNRAREQAHFFDYVLVGEFFVLLNSGVYIHRGYIQRFIHCE